MNTQRFEPGTTDFKVLNIRGVYARSNMYDTTGKRQQGTHHRTNYFSGGLQNDYVPTKASMPTFFFWLLFSAASRHKEEKRMESVVCRIHVAKMLSHFSRVRLCATHRRQPTRLPCPWDSPGKNTGVGCHPLLQCMKVKSESEVAQSQPTLSDPWTAAYQAPLSMGFSRQEYWSGVPLPSPH